jgi:uncharacterized protein YcgI (DUF1989 family)
VPEVVMAEHAGLGARCRQVVVPAQSGRAVSVSRGDLVRVVDIEGHQVGDMWAVDAADHGRWLSVSHTRDRCERLFPAVGGQFCDQRLEPVLELASDTSPGVHDMLFPPCDRWLYESRGLAGHPNCRDNFLAAIPEHAAGRAPFWPDNEAAGQAFVAEITEASRERRGVGMGPLLVSAWKHKPAGADTGRLASTALAPPAGASRER